MFTKGTSFETAAPFGMSGDGNADNVGIPSIFLFNKEGEALLQHIDDIFDRENKNILAVLYGDKMEKSIAAEQKKGWFCHFSVGLYKLLRLNKMLFDK